MDYEALMRAQGGADPVDQVDGPAEPQEGDANPYLAMMQAEKDSRQRAAVAATMGDAGADPERAGRALRLAGQTGLPAAAIEPDPEPVAQQEEARRRAAILRENPVLAEWVTAHPVAARAATDDLGTLARLARAAGAGWTEGETPDFKGKPFTPQGALEWMGYLGGQVAGAMTEAYGSKEAMAGAAGGAAIGLMGGPALPVTEPTAGFIGWQAGAISHVVDTHWGPAMQRAAQLRDADGRPLPAAAQAGVAMVDAGIQAAMTTLGGGEAARAAEEALAEAVRRPGVVAALAGYGKGMLKAAAHGFGAGAGSSLANAGAAQVAMAASNALAGTDFVTAAHDPAQVKEILGNAVQEGLKWAMFGAAAHGAAGAVGLGRDMLDARRSARMRQQMGDLLDTSAESKLQGRAPDAFREFMQAQVGGGPVETIELPAAKILELYQHFGVDPWTVREDPLFGWEPDMRDKLRQAQEDGTGKVSLSTAGYAAHLAGTDLDRQLRPDIAPEGGISAREHDAALADLQSRMQDEMDRLNVEMAQDNAAQSAMEAVYRAEVTRMRDKLGMSAHQADQNARLVAARYEAAAKVFAADPANPRDDVDAFTLYSQGLGGTEYRRVLADAGLRPRRHDVGPMDALLNDIRDGRPVPAERDMFGPGLAEWLAETGGIKDEGGELSARDLHRWHLRSQGLPKLVRDGGRTLEDAAQAAADDGFLPEVKAALEAGEPVDLRGALLDALDRDVRGDGGGVRSEALADREREAHAATRAALEEELSRAGVDLKSPDWADNTRVKEALGEWADKAEGGREMFAKGDGPQGSTQFFHQPGERVQAILNLFRGADKSTFAHESAHIWLEELRSWSADPAAPDQFRRDLETVTQWMGVDSPEKIEAAHHELFARAWEKYLMEGKAPSVALEGVFQRFASWLAAIYRRLGGGDAAAGLDRAAAFPVRLDPAITDVFDRMLASEDEIKLARERQQLQHLFASPEEMGVDEETWRAYLRAVEGAHAAAVSQVEKKALAAVRREHEAWWKEQADKLKAEVAPQVDARPDVQVLRYFRTGVLPDGSSSPKVKLDRAAVVRMFGSEGILKEMRTLSFGGVTVQEGGIHPDILGETFGFRDGREMLTAALNLARQERDLREATGRKGLKIRDWLVDSQVKDTLLERHGDPLKDGTLADEALDAVHSDRQGEILSLELAALDARARSVTYKGRKWLVGQLKPHEVAKARAEAMVAKMAERDLRNLNRFAFAEAKAGREAQVDAARGEYLGARQAKERQIMAGAMYRAARDAAEEMEKGVKLLGGYGKKATIKGMDQGYLDQIHGLLERFDFRPASKVEVGRRQSLAEWVREREDAGAEVAISAKLRDQAFRQHYSTLTVAEMRDLVDAVKNIAHLGKLKQELKDGKEKREFEAWKGDAFDHLSRMPVRAAPKTLVMGGRGGLKGAIERSGMALRAGAFELLKAETIIDWLDDHDPNGPFNRVLFRPMKEAMFGEYERQKEIVGRLKNLEAQMPKDWAKSLDEEHTLPMLNADGQRLRAEKRHILGIALNWGNESNRDKLLRGEGGDKFGWSQDNVEAVLARHMTEADWRFVQGVWDTFESLWPDIAAMQKRLSGVEPDRVQPLPVATPFGTFRGGYFPVIYDPRRSDRARANLDKEATALYDRATYARATTPKGHTISRTDYAAPLDFRSLELLPHRLGQHVHDLYFREAVNQADRVLRDRDVRQWIADRLGLEAVAQLDKWVRAAANDRNIDPANYTSLERFLRKARANTVAVGIAFRLGTILKHDLSALSMSIEAVGWKAFLGATADLCQGGVGARNALVKEIMGKSGEIRNRMNQYDRDTQAQTEKLAQYSGFDTARGALRAVVTFADEFNHLGHMPVAYLDWMSTLPVWLATYRDGVAKGLAEDEAVYAADKMVRKAHGSQSVVDQASIQRGSELKKMLTMFYGFFNRSYNAGADAAFRIRRGIEARKMGDETLARADFLKAASFAVGSLMVPALIDAMVSGHRKKDDETWLGWAAKAVLGQALATVPMARDLAAFFLHGHEYQFSPVVGSIATVAKTVRDEAAKMFSDDPALTGWDVKRMLTAGGLVTGVGTGQLAQSAQYLWDVLHDRQQPEDGADFLRGVLFGEKPKQR